MLDPHDDTDVPSGTTDGAQMESTSPPVHRLDFCSQALLAQWSLLTFQSPVQIDHGQNTDSLSDNPMSQ